MIRGIKKLLNRKITKVETIGDWIVVTIGVTIGFLLCEFVFSLLNSLDP